MKKRKLVLTRRDSPNIFAEVTFGKPIRPTDRWPSSLQCPKCQTTKFYVSTTGANPYGGHITRLQCVHCGTQAKVEPVKTTSHSALIDKDKRHDQ